MNTERIGLIGTGIMGSPMAKNLLKAGWPLTVYARRDNIKKEFSDLGAEIALTPAELAAETASSFFLLIMLRMSRNFYVLPTASLAEDFAPGTVIADMTTTDPEFPRVTSKQLAAKGIDYLDAPISGGALGAQNAQLVIMVGGKKEAMERCLPVFTPVSKKVVYMGESGSGQTVKLIPQPAFLHNLCGCLRSSHYWRKARPLGGEHDRCLQQRNRPEFCH